MLGSAQRFVTISGRQVSSQGKKVRGLTLYYLLQWDLIQKHLFKPTLTILKICRRQTGIMCPVRLSSDAADEFQERESDGKCLFMVVAKVGAGQKKGQYIRDISAERERGPGWRTGKSESDHPSKWHGKDTLISIMWLFLSTCSATTLRGTQRAINLVCCLIHHLSSLSAII